MKKLLFLVFLFQSLICQATTHKVGSTRTYISPNALYQANVIQDGDSIEIDTEAYIGPSALAVWQSHDLFIKGVGGKPHLVADGAYILGKGIWVLAGDNITVENIEFSEASVPDQNGAGIRLDGVGLTLRHCYFHDNENGILTSNPYEGNILIEFCEFENNGFGDGFSHNLYIGHVNKLTFRFNYSHHTNIGHNLKSRANENFIYYNRIMDEETGNSSRLIDLSNGGFSIVMGNLFMQGDNAPNNNMIAYGKEGLENTAPHKFYFINNTLVNKRMTSCRFLDIEGGTEVANVSNNIFAGTGTIIEGMATVYNNNITEQNIEDLNFVDEANYNYDINENSPAMNAGAFLGPVNGYSLTPDSAYVHPLNFKTRANVNGPIDSGAYEFPQSLSVSNQMAEGLSLFPNPTNGKLNISLETNQIESIHCYNYLGQLVLSERSVSEVDLSNLLNGVYFLEIKKKDGTRILKSVIRE